MKRTYYFFTAEGFTTVQADNDKEAVEMAKSDAAVIKVVAADNSREVYVKNDQAS